MPHAAVFGWLRRRTAPVLLCALALATAPAAAWTPRTRIQMADEAVRLMPASLRLALERHREDLLRGALEPMAAEDGPAHRAPWSGGSLDAEIALRAQEIVDLVEAGAPFARIARSFGALAHHVCDAGYPPGVAGASGAARYSDFAAFVESRQARFPLVFYGHADPDLDRGDFRAFARRVMERARSEDGNLARAYESAGDLSSSRAFDDRSVPFAVASLCYSRTVTDVVRAWLAAWKRARGDLGRTPYASPPSSPSPGEAEGKR